MTGATPPLRPLVSNEARAYAAFAGGRVADHGFAVSLVCERLPEPRFNRSYVLESESLTPDSIQALSGDFAPVPLPFRMDVFLPISRRIEDLLERSGFEVTESFASEMVLVGSSQPRPNDPAVRIERVSQAEIDTFSAVLMASYEMPAGVFPVALPILHETIGNALEREGAMLYLGFLGSQAVGVLYLFADEGVGGIYNVGVLPESRKQGVARALMRRAIDDARENRLSALCLQCRAESFQERFYRELGFEVVARRSRAVRAAA
jgi:ribosomal protein S18 acetylase RimI-like enzyme